MLFHINTWLAVCNDNIFSELVAHTLILFCFLS